jgi:DNA helicase-2/ATP-dependent DNA helicase PcrA
LFAERAFLLRMEGFAVSGRIDAVFGGSVEGPWEVVDWKTGRRPAADDPLAGLQLDLYGLACVEVWDKRPEDLSLTYLYLAGGEEVSHPMGDPDEVRERVARSLRAIGESVFDPTPGTWCHHCDFLTFCEAGRGWVAAQGT